MSDQTVLPAFLPLHIGPLTSLDDIRTANRAAGNHWFEPATLRFFKSRVSQEVYTGLGGCYFVSSEQYDRQPRRYTVRQARADGAIATHPSGFQGFATLATAKRHARVAASQEAR